MILKIIIRKHTYVYTFNWLSACALHYKDKLVATNTDLLDIQQNVINTIPWYSYSVETNLQVQKIHDVVRVDL